MSSFPWLTVIGAIPLVGALVIAIIPAASSDDKAALGGAVGPEPAERGVVGPELAEPSRDLLTKQIALVTSLVTLGLTAAMSVKFSPSGLAIQCVEIHQWTPQIGVNSVAGVNAIALVLIDMIMP